MGLTRKTSSWYLTDSLCKAPSWIIHFGDILYDCWQCIYESLFWLMYLLSCTWESHQQQKQRSFDDAMTFSANDDGFYIPTVSTTTQAAASRHHLTTTTVTTKNRSKGNIASGDIRLFRYSKLDIKRVLKAHLNTIRQKQRVFNGVMKRSLLRRARQITLLQPPPSPVATTISMTTVSPLFLHSKSTDNNGHISTVSYQPPPPPLLHHRSKKFISPLPPLKTLAHQGKLTPEIVSLSKSLIMF